MKCDWVGFCTNNRQSVDEYYEPALKRSANKPDPEKRVVGVSEKLKTPNDIGR